MDTNDRMREAVKMRLAGSTYRDIGSRFGIVTQRAYQIIQMKIDRLLNPLCPPNNPEDQYLADTVLDSPYLATSGKKLFLDNSMDLIRKE